MFIKRASLVLISAAMLGCSTNSKTGSVRDISSISTNLGVSSFSDLFSSDVRELKRLVNESQLDQAESFFTTNSSVFAEKYKDNQIEIPEQFQVLGKYVFESRLRPRIQNSIDQLKLITDVGDKNNWPVISSKLNIASILSADLSKSSLLRIAKVGGEEQELLKNEIARVKLLANNAKPYAVMAMMDEVLASGKHSSIYINQITINENDFLRSLDFQSAIVDKVSSALLVSNNSSLLSGIKKYLTPNSRSKLDVRFFGAMKEKVFSDGMLSINKLQDAMLSNPPFGSSDAFSKVFKIGFIEDASPKQKSINGEHAFDIALNSLSVGDRVTALRWGESIDTNLGGYEIIIMTQAIDNKITRAFKNRRDVASRNQVGTREVLNPDYSTAVDQYILAQRDQKNYTNELAARKPCSGLACAVEGFSDGYRGGEVRTNLDKARNNLQATSKTKIIPIFEDYNYQTVAIESKKTATIAYQIIDIKNKNLFKGVVSVSDAVNHDVVYGLRGNDINEKGIKTNLKSESDVSQWEGKGFNVDLRRVISSLNKENTVSEAYSDLKVAASFSRSERNKTASNVDLQPPSPTTVDAESNTIADARFASVVVIRNAASMGTGFYVAPNVILTAYHVVEGSNLLEISHHNGSNSSGSVIDFDSRLDLALIKVGERGQPLQIHSGPLKLGEAVEAIGHPKGYEYTITRGVISALRKQKSSVVASSQFVEFVQTDTPISPGNSGGPLLLKDKVIGVNDWIRVDKGSQNLNFSVSHNEIRAYLKKNNVK